MSVDVRTKTLKKGKLSLYLDIYNEGKRTYQFLKLYPLESPKTTEERKGNKEIYRRAEAARVKTEHAIINQNDVSRGFKKSDLLFLDYFKVLTEERKSSAGNYGNWDSAFKILEQLFGGKKVKIADLKDNDLLVIKNYFINGYKTKSNTSLSKNAASSYFNKVKACLNRAFDDKIINDKIGSRIKSIKGEETRREYLTAEEIIAIEKAECESAILKSAFLFSVYTGLRWSDINGLQWKHIQYTAERGYSLNFIQQKTKGVEYLPIPEKAITFLGEPAADEDRVFKGLKYSAWHNLKIREWMIKAGVKRKITFHSGRHTYATVLLTKNIDIYTVSSMLGHRNLKTTQVYAKVIDQRKIDAVKVFDKL